MDQCKWEEARLHYEAALRINRELGTEERGAEIAQTISSLGTLALQAQQCPQAGVGRKRTEFPF